MRGIGDLAERGEFEALMAETGIDVNKPYVESVCRPQHTSERRAHRPATRKPKPDEWLAPCGDIRRVIELSGKRGSQQRGMLLAFGMSQWDGIGGVSSGSGKRPDLMFAAKNESTRRANVTAEKGCVNATACRIRHYAVYDRKLAMREGVKTV